ncbi:hypothetical protein GCM10023259_060950 [Thermocatellispora tengchongensis]
MASEIPIKEDAGAAPAKGGWISPHGPDAVREGWDQPSLAGRGVSDSSAGPVGASTSEATVTSSSEA